MSNKIVDIIDLAEPVETLSALFEGGDENRIFTIKTQKLLECFPPVNLIDNEDSNLFINSNVPILYNTFHRTNSPTLTSLSNVTLFLKHAYLIDQQDRLVAETYHNRDLIHVLLQETTESNIDNSLRNSKLHKIDQPVFCGVGPWCWIYHHWLIETFPRLMWLDQHNALKDCLILVPNNLTLFQLETLDSLGLDRSRFLEFDGGLWQFQRLYFPSFPAPGGYSIRQVEWLKKTLYSAFKIEPSSRKRRLHVSRQDAGSRRLVNEEDVNDLLAGYGFETVTLSGLTVAEQIRLFSEVELVAGSSGSGFSNMIFAPNDAGLLEFQPSNYINRAHWYLCCAAAQRYAFVIGDKGNHTNDFSVNLYKIEASLQQLIR